MKFKTTAILLSALVAIGAYFFLVEEKDRKAKEDGRTKNRELFRYEPTDIEKFDLINSAGERVEVEHTGSDWKVVFPVTAPGDEPAISSFIALAVPGLRGEEITNVASLADYGFEKPFATLILYHRGAAMPDTLYVGDETPTSSSSYVRIGTSRTVLISRVLTHSAMKKSLLHFRDKNFLTFDRDAIDALMIRAGTRRMQLKREGKDWFFADRHVRADRRKIEPYLTELTRAVIRRFIREDLEALAQYGLKTPANELTLTCGAETIRIAFGSLTEDEVYAVRTGLDKVICLEARLLAAFNWNPENMRAMNLAFFQNDSVKVITYETPDTAVVFTRIGNKWSTTGADTLAIQSIEVNALLRKLDAVTFDTIVREPLLSGEPKLTRFKLRVTLEDASGSVLDQITLAEPVPGSEVGASTSANALGALAKGTFDGIHMIFERIGANR
jgi:hypothetical protein